MINREDARAQRNAKDIYSVIVDLRVIAAWSLSAFDNTA